MTISVQDEVNLVMYQGDSGFITLQLYGEIPEGSLIYFNIYNCRYNSILPEEIKSRVDADGYVTFEITSDISDLLRVRKCEEYQVYYFGLKQVDEQTLEENTIFLLKEGTCPKYSDMYKFIVYHKKAEGLG